MCLNRVVFPPEVVARMPPAIPLWADMPNNNNVRDTSNRWNQSKRRNGVHKCPICQHLSPTQSAMLAALASLFECSFLVFSAFTALVSILQPKVKHCLLLALLPLALLLPEAIVRKASATFDKAELREAPEGGVISYHQNRRLAASG